MQNNSLLSDYSNRILKFIDMSTKAKVTLAMKSQPGIGKTALIEQLAWAKGYGIWKIVSSTMDPTDVMGLPFRVERYDAYDGTKTVDMEFSSIGWGSRLNREAEEKGGAILFIDELTTGPKSVQNALLTLMESRHFANGQKLHDNIVIITAMNPQGSGVTGVTSISPALANRMAHLDYDPPVEDWLAGVTDNWGRCTDHDELASRALVAAYIRNNKAALHMDISDPKNASQATGAWPSRRSWDNLAKMLAYTDEPEMKKMAAIALVGKGAAQRFIQWEKGFTLPDPEDVVANPPKVKWGKDTMKHYAILQSVIDTYARTNDRDLITPVMEYMADNDDIGTDVVASLIDRALVKSEGRPPAGIFKIRGMEQFMLDAGLVNDDLDG